MKLKIINTKKISIDGKEYNLPQAKTNEEILTALRRGVLETTTGNIVSEDTTIIIRTGAKTFSLNGKNYTLDKERTQEQLLRDISNKGFVKLSNGDYLNTSGSGSSSSGSGSGNTLNRIKEYQKNYLNTAGTRNNPSGDTGIATSNTLTDLLSLFFLGNYKEYIQRNKDSLEIAFLLGDRRSSIDRQEWTEYFSLNSLTTETSVLLDLKGQEYDFKVQFDNNLNLKITDDHVSQENYFGALFSISIRHKV